MYAHMKKCLTALALILLSTSVFAENRDMLNASPFEESMNVKEIKEDLSDSKHSVQICEAKKPSVQKNMIDDLDFQQRHLRHSYDVI